MQLEGEWHRGTDGITRPTILGRVQAGTGPTTDERFLIDTGADRTVLSADLLRRLGPLAAQSSPSHVVQGIGGTQACVVVNAEFQFDHALGIASIKSQFQAFTDPAATDLSILGRDVLSLFDLIVSRPRNEVLLLDSPHFYRVGSS